MQKVALLVHLLGVFGLISALAIEVVAFSGLRRAKQTNQAKDWINILAKMGPFFGVSSILILLGGFYLTWEFYNRGRDIGWVIVALITFIIIGGNASHQGRRISNELLKAISGAKESLSPALIKKFSDFQHLKTIYFQMLMVLGIVVLMVFKPSIVWSIIIILLSALIGFGAPRLILKPE